MTPQVRAIIVLSILLAFSAAWIVHREAGLREGTSEPEHRAAVAAIEARNQADRRALISAHKAELSALNIRLATAVADAERELSSVRADLDRERKAKIVAARASSVILKAAVADAARVRESEVHADADTVFITRRAALSWLDNDLALRRELQLCDRSCDVRLAEREQTLVPPLVASRQSVELRSSDLDAELRLAISERDYARRQAAAGKGKTLQWSLIAGALGLFVGGIAGGIGVAYVRR